METSDVAPQQGNPTQPSNKLYWKHLYLAIVLVVFLVGTGVYVLGTTGSIPQYTDQPTLQPSEKSQHKLLPSHQLIQQQIGKYMNIHRAYIPYATRQGLLLEKNGLTRILTLHVS